MSFLLSTFKQQDISIAYTILGEPSHIQKVNDELLAYTWDYYENSQLACRFLLGVHVPTNLIIEYDFHEATFLGCYKYDTNLRTFAQSKQSADNIYYTPEPTTTDTLNFLNNSAFGTTRNMTKTDLTKKGIKLEPFYNEPNVFISEQAPITTNYFKNYVYYFNKKGNLCSIKGMTPPKNNIVDITKTFLGMSELLTNKYGKPNIKDKVTEQFPVSEWSKMVSLLNDEYPPRGIVYTWNKKLVNTFKDADDNNIQTILLFPVAQPHKPTAQNGYVKDVGMTVLEFQYGNCK